MKGIVKIVLLVFCICVFEGNTMHMSKAAELEPLIVGDGQDYPTLNAAIAVAEEGQVIHLAGNVTETNPADAVVINKRVTIQGDGTSVYTYTIKSWGKAFSPFQITAAGVEIADLNLVIDGSTTTCSPMEITGADLSLKRSSITLTGTQNTKFSPISVGAGGLIMEEVTIPSTARSAKLVDLQGNNANLKKVSITAGANTIGIYSATAPNSLILDHCTFTATAATSTMVSLPNPDGLTLTGCDFSFTGSGTGFGLVFVTPSDSIAGKVLTANGCVFNMNAAGTGIDLNGYNGIFTACEFNYSKGGTGVLSQSSSNADLTFNQCAFYMGKNSGDKATSAKGLVLKNSDHGNLLINDCKLIVSCDPEAAVPTTAASSLIISATDGILKNLTIKDSDITLNTGAGSAIGVDAIAQNLIITNSNFKVNVGKAKGVVVSGIENGMIRDCIFDIAQAGAIGLNFTDSNLIQLVNNTYNLSASGNGVTMTNTTAGTSNVLIDNNTLYIQNNASSLNGLLFENFHSLEIRNNTKIMVDDTKGTITCVAANQIKSVIIDDLDIDLKAKADGVVIDGTKFPQGQEGSVIITNSSAILSGGTAKGIRAMYVRGALIRDFVGTCEKGANNSSLFTFTNSTDVEVINCQFNVNGSGATGLGIGTGSSTSVPKDENGNIKEQISENHEAHHNVFNIGEGAKAINITGATIRPNHNVSIHHNKMIANKAASIINIAYGRNHAIYNNEFESIDSVMAIISDGVDETASFSMDTDNDIYVAGEVVDAYRNQIYNNQFSGSYERGIYITNNGDVVRANDFSKAVFNYESTPGTITNTQIIVGFCKDVKILDNKFAQARASDNQVIRVSNTIISEMTGNTTQLVDGASEVLLVQGTTSLAPNGIKYPESITVHNVTNTISDVIPEEMVYEWDNTDNLIYQYILKLIPNQSLINITTYAFVETPVGSGNWKAIDTSIYDPSEYIISVEKGSDYSGEAPKITGYKIIEPFRPETISYIEYVDETNNSLKYYYEAINSVSKVPSDIPPEVPGGLPPDVPPGYENIPKEEDLFEVIDQYEESIGQWIRDEDNGWVYQENSPILPPSQQISPQEDDSFEVMGQDDTPLGLWSKGEDDEWTYEEYPPDRRQIVWVVIGFLALAGLLYGIYFFLWARRYVTREEFVRMLLNEIHLETEIEDTVPYTDVSEDVKYYEAVMNAKSAGLLWGFPDSEFQPHIAITREEIASILAETIRYNNIVIAMDHPVFDSDIKDLHKIEECFIEDTKLVLHFEIMETKTDDTFDPKGLSTRRQADKMIHNLLSVMYAD